MGWKSDPDRSGEPIGEAVRCVHRLQARAGAEKIFVSERALEAVRDPEAYTVERVAAEGAAGEAHRAYRLGPGQGSG